MNFRLWYTHTADVYRVTEYSEGSLIRHRRELVLEGIPCRLYRDAGPAISMDQTAASLQNTLKMACDNKHDVRTGDEIILHHGGDSTRCFAGEVHHYYEPFGGVCPALEHQEITLLEKERVS